MSDPADPPVPASASEGDGTGAEQQPRAHRTADDTERARRRRRDQVFGDVLPDRTADEQDPGAAGGDGDGERWLRAQVPPHHGD